MIVSRKVLQFCFSLYSYLLWDWLIIFLQHGVLCSWKAVVVPAKSVAAENIQFPHALKPQHHVPLPSSVIFINHLHLFFVLFYIQSIRWFYWCYWFILCVWFLQVAGGKHDKDETAPAFEGLFFNYFSVGKLVLKNYFVPINPLFWFLYCVTPSEGHASRFVSIQKIVEDLLLETKETMLGCLV